MRFTDKFTEIYKKLLPSPFTIAIILTLITFLLALIITRPADEGVASYSVELLKSWEEGLWKTGGGGLYFAFQMMLMLVLGHMLAISKPISRLIEALTIPCKNTASSALIVTASTIFVSLFNWGLGLIFGAILARKIGEKFNREKSALNYPLIGAAAYSGLMVWHGGLSGSAPIKAAEEGNLHDLVAGMDVDISVVPNSVGMDQTIFSTMNIVVSFALLVLIPLIMYYIGKRKFKYESLPKPVLIEDESTKKGEGAERLDHSIILAVLIGSVILFYAFHKAVIQPEHLSLGFLTPNFINFFLLGLGLIFHMSISKYVKAANQAITGATGILLQFPLYFGILGIMIGSGLIVEISDWFVSMSTTQTFPIFTYISAGLVNVFVPSGGGQWVVQGPIIISAAQNLGVSYPKAIMALAYGDQLTNMIQPFWALPLLGITGLKAKDILPYTLVLFLAGGAIFLFALIVF